MLENRIPPPLVAVTVAAGMWELARWSPVVSKNSVLRLMAGALLVIAVGVAVSAMLAFRRANTTIDPVHPERASSLVTGGIFRFTRNPMYLGLATLLVAWCVHLAAPWTIAGPTLFVAYITRFQILPEERAMRDKFGAAYVEYRSAVRRWL